MVMPSSMSPKWLPVCHFKSDHGSFQTHSAFGIDIPNQINQSIKTGFLIYTGAGTHPKNRPCQRLGSAQRSAPVKGRLQSTVPNRRSPHIPILSQILSQSTGLQVVLHTLSPGLCGTSRALLPRNWPCSYPVYFPGGPHDMPIPPETALTNLVSNVT